jgi:microcystin-dependent protein
MPRNSQGLYTLPAGNPVVPNTLIEANWANPTMDDIAAALTGSLPRDGSAPMTGPLTLASGMPTAARHATSKAYVDQFLAYASGFPVGAVTAYAGATAPGGYLECNGQAVSRTTYADLFTAIGTTYGSGDNSTTFNVPDMRDEFIRGKSDSRPVGNKQAASFASHTHATSDPGHTHGASSSQNAHSHGLNVNAHSHGVNDPSHRHDAVVGIGVSGSGLAGGSGILLEYQTKFATTGISIQSAGNIGGSTDSQTPGIGVSVAGAATGLSIGAAGGDETRPQNIAQIYIIKAVQDASGPVPISGITTSDAQMISVDNTSPVAPELVIHSNVAFGTVKLDAGGKVPLNQMPTSGTQFMGYFDASSGNLPVGTFVNGNYFIISVSGTLDVYDPTTFVSSPTVVNVGNNIQWVESVVNPVGWYYVVAGSVIPASNVSYLSSGAGAVQTTVQSVLARQISVKDFGAKGDGVTDDTVAIQAAIAYAQTLLTSSNSQVVILFPTGDYLYSTLLVSEDRVILGGTGELIKSGATGNGVVFHKASGPMYESGIDGLTLSAKIPCTSGALLYLDTVNQGTFTLSVKGGGWDGIYVTKSTQNVFTNISVEGCINTGITLSDCADAYCDNTRSDANGNSGIFMDSCSGVYFSNVAVWSNGGVGIDIATTFPPTVADLNGFMFFSNCVSDTSGSHNWRMDKLIDSSFVSCWGSSQGPGNPTGNGFILTLCSNITLSSCVALTNSDAGLVLDGCVGITVGGGALSSNGVRPASTNKSGLTIIGDSQTTLVGVSMGNSLALANTQEYGLRATDTPAVLIVSGCDMQNNLIKPYLFEYPPIKFKENSNVLGEGYSYSSNTRVEVSYFGNYFEFSGSAEIYDIMPSWTGRKLDISFTGNASIVDKQFGSGFALPTPTVVPGANGTASFVFNGTYWLHMASSVNDGVV